MTKRDFAASYYVHRTHPLMDGAVYPVMHSDTASTPTAMQEAKVMVDRPEEGGRRHLHDALTVSTGVATSQTVDNIFLALSTMERDKTDAMEKVWPGQPIDSDKFNGGCYHSIMFRREKAKEEIKQVDACNTHPVLIDISAPEANNHEPGEEYEVGVEGYFEDALMLSSQAYSLDVLDPVLLAYAGRSKSKEDAFSSLFRGHQPMRKDDVVNVETYLRKEAAKKYLKENIT